MKRIVTVFAVLTLLLMIAGCTSRDYESNMELGKEQLQEENYLEAYEAFAAAYKDNESAEAKELKELSKLLADGINQYKQEKYEAALTFFEKAAGYEATTKAGKRLIVKADEWVSEVDNIQNGLAPIQEGQLEPDDPATLEEGNMEVPEGEENVEDIPTPSNPDDSVDNNDSANPDNSVENNDSTNSDNRDEANNSTSKITVQEAEQLVKDFIEIEDYPQLRVQYDHDDEKGDYIFQVFESVEDGQGGHTATWGWYRVNPTTKEVYDIM